MNWEVIVALLVVAVAGWLCGYAFALIAISRRSAADEAECRQAVEDAYAELRAFEHKVQKATCRHPHNPPASIVGAEPGTYTYLCPECGSEKRLRIVGADLGELPDVLEAQFVSGGQSK